MHLCPACFARAPGFHGPEVELCPGCGARLSPWPSAWLPDPKPFAEGGFSVVFRVSRGEEIGLLKVPCLSRERRTPGTVQAARQVERDALAAMPIPSAGRVPTILDEPVVPLDSGPWPTLIMTLLPGRPLSDSLGDALPPPRLCAILRQLCSILADCSEAFPAHLDLKPTNVLVDDTEDLVVGLIDFGNAARSGRPQGLTHEWSAPEVLAAQEGDQDSVGGARSDVWSLGLLLFCGLTGRHPMELAHRGSAPPPLPRSLRVPRALRTVVRRCLQRDPRLRFPDPAALGRALAAIDLPSYRTRAVHPGAAEQPPPWTVDSVRQAERPIGTPLLGALATLLGAPVRQTPGFPRPRVEAEEAPRWAWELLERRWATPLPDDLPMEDLVAFVSADNGEAVVELWPEITSGEVVDATFESGREVDLQGMAATLIEDDLLGETAPRRLHLAKGQVALFSGHVVHRIRSSGPVTTGAALRRDGLWEVFG